MIPNNEVFYLVEESRDSYNTVTATRTYEVWGVIDRETRFEWIQGALQEMGKGSVYTSENRYTFEVNKTIQIDGVNYEIKRVSKNMVSGNFHHWDIIYG